MPRQMPQAGYYVLKHGIYTDIDGSMSHGIIHTTGVRGKGGHKYWNSQHKKLVPPPNNINDWNTLLWTCVPGIKELQRDYDYYGFLPAALAAY